MTKQEQMINWDAIMESGSMTAIHNIREYIRELERDRADLISIRNARAKCNCEDKDKLTEAKELLNMFLRLNYNPIVDEHTLVCKVKQFLSSLE